MSGLTRGSVALVLLACLSCHQADTAWPAATAENEPCRFPCVHETSLGLAHLSFKADSLATMTPIKARLEFHEAIESHRTVKLDIDMEAMDMGVNLFKLESSQGKVWQGDVILPACHSGDPNYFADVLVDGDALTRFRFLVPVAGP